MIGEDFVKFAGQLAATGAAGHDECCYRTVISRSYYGAFHAASEVLQVLGRRVKENASGHREAVDSLRYSKVADAQQAGGLLDDLHAARIKADYRKGNAGFYKAANARLNVEDAFSALSSLEKCLQEPAKAALIAEFSK